AEQDRVSPFDLGDQLLRQLPRGGLGWSVLVSRDQPREAALAVEVWDRVGAEVAVSHRSAGMSCAPNARGTGSQRAADGLVAANARIDVKQMGHAGLRERSLSLVDVKLPPPHCRPGHWNVGRIRPPHRGDRANPGNARLRAK